MIAVARNISHGAAYNKYTTGKKLAVFVGAKNVIANTDLIVSNDQLDDLWDEFEDAGRDYVKRGKDVTNTIIAIEYSPTMNESANWTKQDWFNRAEELLKEIDSTDHSKAKRDPKTGDWIRDENGKKILFPVPHTQLNKSKWMAMLHRDSDSGIYHLHIAVSRFTEDNKLNCVTDIAKRSAIAAESINKRNGWTQAMDIRQQHIDEINAVINAIMDEMPGEKFDAEYFKKSIESTTYLDYKNRHQNYTVELHRNSQGIIDGYAIGRGKSTFTALQLGQKIKAIPVDVETEIKDNIYDVLRTMNTPKFDWDSFIKMLESKTYTDAEGNEQHYQFDGSTNPDGGYYNYSVIRDGKKYNASQIGSKLTAKKIFREYEKERQKALQKARQAAANNIQAKSRSELREQPSSTPEKKSSSSGAHQIKHEDISTKVTKVSSPSQAETERQSAIEKARETLSKWSVSHKMMFSESDENILGLGIGAKCIENGQSPWVDVNMQGAARELGNEVAENTSLSVLRMTQLAGEILMTVALPENVFLGGPGSNNNLPKQKDDNWNRFKNAFGMYLRRSSLKR